MDLAASPAHTLYQQSVFNASTNHYVRPDQASSYKQMYCTSRFQAKNIPSSTFVEGDSLVEFQVDAGGSGIDTLQNAWLQMIINNNDAVNSADVLQSPFIINRVEMYIAEALIETIFPIQIWAEHLLFSSTEKWFSHSTWMEYDRTTGDNQTNNILPSSSHTFIIPLPLAQIASKIPVSLIRQNTVFKVYFNTTANIQSNAGTPSTSLSLTDCKLYWSGIKFHPSVKALIAKELFGRAIASRFYRRNQTRNIINVTAGTSLDVSISEFVGYTPDVKYILRRITNPQDVSQNWITINTQTNLDSNGSPIALSGQERAVVEMNMFRCYPNISHRMRDGTNVKPMSVFPFADDPVGAVVDSLSSGDIKYKPSFSTQLVSSTTGTFELLILTYSKSCFQLENGNCSFRIVNAGDDALGAV